MYPQKLVSLQVQVTVNCTIKKIEFESRLNKKDYLNIISKIKPKKLVLFRCTQRQTEDFVSGEEGLQKSLAYLGIPFTPAGK